FPGDRTALLGVLGSEQWRLSGNGHGFRSSADLQNNVDSRSLGDINSDTLLHKFGEAGGFHTESIGTGGNLSDRVVAGLSCDRLILDTSLAVHSQNRRVRDDGMRRV